ncbi:MAG: hypothetical protein OHM56_02255 [Spiroplasma phoeniceum]|nr:MAG: hypothetical protein OHM57_01700 [Spiroplasma phoeniceum]UZQ32801.1 MAG: hypothetical protein OHM56_02255 [Spiroplasma phoeniceum]
MEEQKIKISASTVCRYMKILQICSEVRIKHKKRIKHFNNMLYEHKKYPYLASCTMKRQKTTLVK